jgi:hypothetical protein
MSKRLERFIYLTHQTMLRRTAELQQRLTINTMLIKHYGPEALPFETEFGSPVMMENVRHRMGMAIAADQLELDDLQRYVIDLEHLLRNYATMDPNDPVDRLWLADQFCGLIRRWNSK